MPLPAGPRRRRIRIERATVTRDTYNTPVESWSTIATLWAEMTPVSDAELYVGGELAATLTARFQVNWSTVAASINLNDRLAYDGRVHNIIGTKEIGVRDGVEITAAARAETPPVEV